MLNTSIVQKLKFIIAAQSSAPPAVAGLLASVLGDELATEVVRAGPGKTEKLPDEVWDFFRSLPGEVQVFIISAFCSAVCRTSDILSSLSPEQIASEIKKATNALGIKPEVKSETIEGEMPVFKFKKTGEA